MPPPPAAGASGTRQRGPGTGAGGRVASQAAAVLRSPRRGAPGTRPAARGRDAAPVARSGRSGVCSASAAAAQAECNIKRWRGTGRTAKSSSTTRSSPVTARRVVGTLFPPLAPHPTRGEVPSTAPGRCAASSSQSAGRVPAADGCWHSSRRLSLTRVACSGPSGASSRCAAARGAPPVAYQPVSLGWAYLPWE